MTPLGRYVVETVLTLLAVAGLAVVVLYFARRAGVGRPSGPLSLAGRLSLDARRAIYLVRVADVIYVVGASEAGLSKLGELPRGTLDALGPELLEKEPTPGFRDILERLRRGGSADRDGGSGDAS
ncbi:MAG TPA: flagellar biosynthetic protein FliO [Polyangiaceae bacterium]|nr:flagellar biosynthetic protein FliO [Polyangiaceae bacterium]